MPEPMRVARAPFAARPEAEYVGRSHELEILGEAGMLLLQGSPCALFLTGPRGVGKTELLLQGAGRCLDGRRGLFTAYLSLERGAGRGGAARLARDLLLAVKAAEGAPVREEDAGDPEWIMRERGAAGALLRRIGGPEEAAMPPWEAVGELAPLLASEARGHLLLFLDGSRRLPATPQARLALGLAGAGGRGLVSCVFAAPGAPGEGRERAARAVRLDPLAPEEAEELLGTAMGKAGIALPRDSRPAAALLGGLPALIWGAAAAARLAGIRGFEDVSSFIRFYAEEQSAGFLDEYHAALFAALPEEERRTALEVTVHLAGRSGSPPDRRTLAREMLKEEERIAPVIARLHEEGLLEDRWGRIVLTASPAALDFCRHQSRLHLEGCTRSEASARLFLEKRSWLAARTAIGAARRNAAELAAFVRSWDGQALPRSLLDHERFEEVAGGDPAPDATKVAAGDRGRLVLPRVIDAWREEFPGSDQVPAYGLDLLALAAGREGEERWLAMDLRLEAAEVTAAMVADFDRRCRLFLARADLKPSALTCWVISGGTFSAEAREAVRTLRIWSSGPAQLRLMAGITGYAGTMRLTLPKASPAEGEPYTFEMSIPARSETELVAARALEQLGGSLPLGEAEVGKLKMALVEACINAFEHGRSEEKKVHLTFRVLPECIQIDVFNRGGGFVPGRIVKPSVEDKFGAAYKRGWGLPIIRELMDEMEFVQRDEGTLLRMTKYFHPRKSGGGSHDKPSEG